MTTRNITLRDVKDEALIELKAEAAKEKKKLGEAASEAFIYWARHRKLHKKKKGGFSTLKAIDFGPGSENWSKQIDEVLYS